MEESKENEDWKMDLWRACLHQAGHIMAVKELCPRESALTTLNAILDSEESDEVKVRRWCEEMHPGAPEDAVALQEEVNRAARRFVNDHVPEIVSVATQIYHHTLAILRSRDEMEAEEE